MSKITIYSPPATAQIKACAVDFDLRRAPVPVHLVQYDKTIPILAVSLYKGSSPYTLPADAEVNVRMNKRKNLCVYNPALGCNESRDMVYVAVTPQMTTQDGTFEPILEVVINSGVAGTSPLQLVIRRNPVQEDAIEDTSEVKTLTELVSQAAASATAAAKSASAAAQDAGNAAASATAAAESDEHATATAQNIKDSLDQIASNAAAVSKLKEDTDALKDGKISKFYASSQGNTNLPDSDVGRIVDFKLYGKSEQKQYSGKNLLDLRSGLGGTGQGVTYTPNGDGSYTRKGTATYINGNVWFLGEYSSTTTLFTLKAGTYTAKDCRIFSGKTVYYDSFTIAGDTPITGVGNPIQDTGTSYNDVIYPRVLAGSTDTGWEPYVGGIPSPNPEYPQEIKSVVNPVVKVMGKNLLKTINWETQTVSGVTIEKTSDTVFKISGTATGDVNFDSSWGQNIKVPAQSYLLCKILNGSCPVGSRVYFFTSNYDSIASEIGGISPLKTSAISCGLVRFYIKEGSNINCTVGLSLQMDTSTNYEPYTEQTATLPYTLNAIPVTSGGNVTIDGQQYVADYVDVERGKLVRMCSLVDAKSFTWGYDRGWSGDGYYSYDAAISNAFWNGSRGYVKSSICEEKPRGEYSSALRNTIMVAGAGNNVEFVGVSQNSLQSWKEYINANEVDILYALKSPVEVDLTADEIAAFKSLVSNYPATNVSTTSDQLDGYTVFNYPISLANGWNYVKQQLGDTRDYLYGIDLMTADAYVNSEYAAALAEIEV